MATAIGGASTMWLPVMAAMDVAQCHTLSSSSIPMTPAALRSHLVLQASQPHDKQDDRSRG